MLMQISGCINITRLYIFIHRYSSYTNSQPKSNNHMPPPCLPASGRTGGYNQSQSNRENMHATTNFRPFHSHACMNNQAPGHGINRQNDNICSTRGQGFTPHKTGDYYRPQITESLSAAPNMARSVSPVDTGPPGRAMEPAKHHVCYS